MERPLDAVLRHDEGDGDDEGEQHDLRAERSGRGGGRGGERADGDDAGRHRRGCRSTLMNE
eukprot:31086-Pelagococcus_subviridis.AAC.6